VDLLIGDLLEHLTQEFPSPRDHAQDKPLPLWRKAHSLLPRRVRILNKLPRLSGGRAIRLNALVTAGLLTSNQSWSRATICLRRICVYSRSQRMNFAIGS